MLGPATENVLENDPRIFLSQFSTYFSVEDFDFLVEYVRGATNYEKSDLILVVEERSNDLKYLLLSEISKHMGKK